MKLKPRTDITELRKARQETTAQFGEHFARSGRTIEDWEQGRRTPDRLCERILAGLKADRTRAKVEVAIARHA